MGWLVTPVTPELHEGETLKIFAKDQPEYLPLPAAVSRDMGRVSTEWEPTAEELAVLMAGGRIRLSLMTFGHPLQPVLLTVVPAAAAGLEDATGVPC